MQPYLFPSFSVLDMPLIIFSHVRIVHRRPSSIIVIRKSHVPIPIHPCLRGLNSPPSFDKISPPILILNHFTRDHPRQSLLTQIHPVVYIPSIHHLPWTGRHPQISMCPSLSILGNLRASIPMPCHLEVGDGNRDARVHLIPSLATLDMRLAKSRCLLIS